MWIGVQPWLRWAQLTPDVSHRLTLMVCALAMGLCSLGLPRAARSLPATWLWVVWGSVAVIACQVRPIVLQALYLTQFHETAALSDGALIVVSGAWGVWAFRQYPLTWARRLRWAGLALLAVSVWMAWGQSQWGRHLGAGGLLGMDRCLGAYAVLWAPILMAWNPWLFLLPLLAVWLSGKLFAWVGLCLVIARARWRWKWALLLGCLIAAQRSYMGSHALQVIQRVTTWGPLMRALPAHPFIGWGFDPMAYGRIAAAFHPAMPNAHSDWLALALFGGWPLALLVGWAWWRIVRTAPTTRWMAALRTSVFATGVCAFGQEAISHARVAGTMLLLLGWWAIERDATTTGVRR